MLTLQRVHWDIKGERGHVITRYKDFDDVPSACSFVKEIKGFSLSKPIMDEITIEKRKGKK
jgi:hypothetical protein